MFYYITITNIFQYKFRNSPWQHCRDRRPRLSLAFSGGRRWRRSRRMRCPSLQTNFFRVQTPLPCANTSRATRQAHSIFARKSQIFFKNACFVPLTRKNSHLGCFFESTTNFAAQSVSVGVQFPISLGWIQSKRAKKDHALRDLSF